MAFVVCLNLIINLCEQNSAMSWEVSIFYLAVIGLEILVSNYQHRRLYTWPETLTTLALSLWAGLLDLAVRGAYLALMVLIFQHRLLTLTHGWFYWFLLFLLVDFQFYWLHRLEHFCRLFWASHVTHHSAEHMNISVGFRASLVRPLYDFVFFLPLTLAGFYPLDILLMYSLLQLWAVLVHTELVGRLGWLEYFLVTPSHHRVHHASNDRYIDKNMGMTLILWDRLFGTFQRQLPEAEYEPIRYGLVTPLEKGDLRHVVFREWSNILRDVKRKDITWKQKIRYVFGPPGWKHTP